MAFMLSRLTLANFQPEDDIDKLFNRLSQVEPPGELVSCILSRIRHIPVPPAPKVQPDAPAHEKLDSLVVRNEKRDPS